MQTSDLSEYRPSSKYVSAPRIANYLTARDTSRMPCDVQAFHRRQRARQHPALASLDGGDSDDEISARHPRKTAISVQSISSFSDDIAKMRKQSAYRCTIFSPAWYVKLSKRLTKTTLLLSIIGTALSCCAISASIMTIKDSLVLSDVNKSYTQRLFAVSKPFGMYTSSEVPWVALPFIGDAASPTVHIMSTSGRCCTARDKSDPITNVVLDLASDPSFVQACGTIERYDSYCHALETGRLQDARAQISADGSIVFGSFATQYHRSPRCGVAIEAAVQREIRANTSKLGAGGVATAAADTLSAITTSIPRLAVAFLLTSLIAASIVLWDLLLGSIVSLVTLGSTACILMLHTLFGTLIFPTVDAGISVYITLIMAFIFSLRTSLVVAAAYVDRHVEDKGGNAILGSASLTMPAIFSAVCATLSILLGVLTTCAPEAMIITSIGINMWKIVMLQVACSVALTALFTLVVAHVTLNIFINVDGYMSTRNANRHPIYRDTNEGCAPFMEYTLSKISPLTCGGYFGRRRSNSVKSMPIDRYGEDALFEPESMNTARKRQIEAAQKAEIVNSSVPIIMSTASTNRYSIMHIRGNGLAINGLDDAACGCSIGINTPMERKTVARTVSAVILSVALIALVTVVVFAFTRVQSNVQKKSTSPMFSDAVLELVPGRPTYIYENEICHILGMSAFELREMLVVPIKESLNEIPSDTRSPSLSTLYKSKITHLQHLVATVRQGQKTMSEEDTYDGDIDPDIRENYDSVLLNPFYLAEDIWNDLSDTVNDVSRSIENDTFRHDALINSIAFHRGEYETRLHALVLLASRSERGRSYAKFVTDNILSDGSTVVIVRLAPSAVQNWSRSIARAPKRDTIAAYIQSAHTLKYVRVSNSAAHTQTVWKHDIVSIALISTLVTLVSILVTSRSFIWSLLTTALIYPSPLVLASACILSKTVAIAPESVLSALVIYAAYSIYATLPTYWTALTIRSLGTIGDSAAATSATLSHRAVLGHVVMTFAFVTVCLQAMVDASVYVRQTLSIAAAAVVIDQILVRFALVPAFMIVFGKMNWWPCAVPMTKDEREQANVRDISIGRQDILMLSSVR